jgi:hypothetical protein
MGRLACVAAVCEGRRLAEALSSETVAGQRPPPSTRREGQGRGTLGGRRPRSQCSRGALTGPAPPVRLSPHGAPLGSPASPVPEDGNAENGKPNESRAEDHHEGKIDTKEFTDGHCRDPNPVHPEQQCYRRNRLETPKAASAIRNAPIKMITLGSTIRKSATPITQSPCGRRNAPLRPAQF